VDDKPADPPSPPSALERALRRDRYISALALAALCIAAWAYLISGAGMGVAAWRMTSLGLPPTAAADSQPAMAGMGAMSAASGGMAAPSTQTIGPALLLATMWFSMMVAMMAPSAAPMVLLYARVARSAVATSPDRPLASMGCFVAGYLAVWLAFAIIAAGLQDGFARLAWISRETMGARSRWFAAAMLLLAGLYQLSPLQQICLRHCRSPALFLAREYRPGVVGALRLGVVHGAYCVGCCWLLMALLFVGGVMNLIWIVGLTVLVVAEKILPAGRWIGRATGVGLIVAAAVVVA